MKEMTVNRVFQRLCRAMADARGFSLVEALVALAVLGILVPAVVGIFMGGNSFLHAAADRTAAVKIAQERIEEIKSKGFAAIDTGELAMGELIPEDYGCIEGYADFRRTTMVSPEDMGLAGEGTPLNGVRITVTVYWNGRENPREEGAFEQQALMSRR